MAINTNSFIAGAGTVLASIVLGFGGAVVLSNAFVGQPKNDTTLMERRAAQSALPAPPPPAPLIIETKAETQAQPPQQQVPAPSAEIRPNNAPQPPAVQPRQVAQPQPVAQPPSESQTSAQSRPDVRPAQQVERVVDDPADSRIEGRKVDKVAKPDNAFARASGDEATEPVVKRKPRKEKWAERHRRKARELDDVAAQVREIEDDRDTGVGLSRGRVDEPRRFLLLDD